MLLYITAEDVFGDEAAPQRRGPRPLHSIPATLAALYDMGMRHHVRAAAMLWPEADALAPVPDWRLDRLVIRIALYSREQLGLEPGTRAAAFGRLGWLWPAVDFAAQGFGAAAVGLEHDLGDDDVAAVLREADPRVVFATDTASAARLLALRARDRLPRATLVGAGAGASQGEMLPLERLLELGGTLDTAERAQAFRLMCRRVEPAAEAVWHASSRGLERLTHAGAMERVAARLRELPAAAGDVAYLQAPRATLGGRLALAAFVGDGHTTAALGRDAAAEDDVRRLRPHGVRAAAEWLEQTCAGLGPRWPGRLDRRGAGRRLAERLGDRLRWVETERGVDEATAAALAALGARVVVVAERRG
jgi:hypothetical protein